MQPRISVSFFTTFLYLTSVSFSGEEVFNPEVSGYYKNLFSVTDQQAGEADLLDDYQRLRFKVKIEPVEWMDINIHYEVRTVSGDTLRLQQQRETSDDVPFQRLALNPNTRARFLDVESTFHSENNLLGFHALDRLRLRFRDDMIQLSLGRQAVSWGTGLIWNPTDLFTAFAPTEIDRDEKMGVDVIRLTWTSDDGTSIDFIGEPLDKQSPYAFDGDDSSWAVRARMHRGEYEISALGGYMATDWVIGGDFTGYVRDAGFRGEWVYTTVDEADERDYVRGLLSLDTSFPTRWDVYVAIEYYYNGLGAGNEDAISRTSFSRIGAATTGSRYGL